MIPKKTYILSLLCFLTLTNKKAFANTLSTPLKKPVLIWQEIDSPPYHFSLDSEFKDKGVADLIRLDIEEILSTYFKLHRERIPITRSLTFLKTKRDYCTIDLRKTKEREEFGLYSPIYNIAGAVHLITLKGYLSKYLNKMNKVSLQHLIRENKQVIGATQSRTFGEIIDKIISDEKVQFPHSFYFHPAHDSRYSLLLMLKSKRINAYLGTYGEIAWMRKTYKDMDFFHIESVPIQENNEKYAGVYFVCSKSKIGKQAIEIITKSLKSKDFNLKKKWMKGATFWFTPNELKMFDIYFDEVLNNQK